MTIRATQPDKLTVVVKTDHSTDLGVEDDNSSLENQRKYHCRFYSARVGWGKCVKSDWLSVVKSCGVCLLLVWVGWLHWSNRQLSVDILELKNQFSFGSRVIESQLEKELHPQVNNGEFPKKHLEYIHLTKRRRRRRNNGKTTREKISDYMKEKTFTLFLPGLNERPTDEGYFKWNLTNVGTNQDFVECHYNGTFTFKKRGFYLVASQLAVKGHNDSQNYAISYGYKTVLDKHPEEVLMLSEITQDNRGVCYSSSSNAFICSTDTISHMVIRLFDKEDRIAIKANTNNCRVNYYLTQKNSYIAIVALDLWYQN